MITITKLLFEAAKHTELSNLIYSASGKDQLSHPGPCRIALSLWLTQPILITENLAPSGTSYSRAQELHDDDPLQTSEVLASSDEFSLQKAALLVNSNTRW